MIIREIFYLLLADDINAMKPFRVFFITLVFSMAIYFIWQNRPKPEELPVLPPDPVVKNVPMIKEENPQISTPAPILSKKEMKDFTFISKNKYFKKIRDTIKDQWKELEDCENEFDLQFGELIAMAPVQQLEFLKDPNNLDNFLEKISSFNMTTPSSAKMIKELAEPIASEVSGKEILDTVGYVKTCRDTEKSTLLWILHNLNIKNQDTARAHIMFFENENSTLTYPEILFRQIYDLKIFLGDYGLKESDFPEIAQIEKEHQEFRKMESDIHLSAEERVLFNSKTQKNDYEYAIKLQAKIKLLLEKVKRNFI